MARLIKFVAKEPALVKVGDHIIKICRCGLTKNSDGLCDSEHEKIKEEDGKVYFYDDEGNKEEVAMMGGDDEESCGCGSGSCGCGNSSCGCGHDHGHSH